MLAKPEGLITLTIAVALVASSCSAKSLTKPGCPSSLSLACSKDVACQNRATRARRGECEAGKNTWSVSLARARRVSEICAGCMLEACVAAVSGRTERRVSSGKLIIESPTRAFEQSVASNPPSVSTARTGDTQRGL